MKLDVNVIFIYYSIINIIMNISTILLLFSTLISHLLSQQCGISQPSSLDDCIQFSNNKSACCFTSVAYDLENDISNTTDLLNYNATFCLLVPYNSTFITPSINTMDVGLANPLNVKLTCPKNYTDDYLKCGSNNPSSLKDCKGSSTLGKTSCCFFRNGNTTRCVLNDGVLDESIKVFGISLECKSSNIWYTIYLFLIVISSIFL